MTLDPSKTVDRSSWVCGGCATVLHHYGLIGYDGPARNGKPDPNDRKCHSGTEWLTLCHRCAAKHGVDSIDA